MTTNTDMRFTCDDFAERLADYLEHDLDAAGRATMDGHAADCAECGALLGDLAAIRTEARALPAIAPSRDLWTGIAARIEAPVVALEPRHAAAPGPIARSSRRLAGWQRQGLAAAALVAVTAGVTHLATREAMRRDPSSVTASTSVAAATVRPSVGTLPTAVPPIVVAAGERTPAAAAGAALVAGSAAGGAPSRDASPPVSARAVRPAAAPNAPLRLASARSGEFAALDSLYAAEIVRLRRAFGLRRSGLDSTTIAVLDRNMGVIDAAIRECRAALDRDPASKYLNEQLNEALESKIELLRAAAMAPIGS